MNSLDEIIELYMRDVDMTLIEESLRRTVEERIQALEEFDRFREELQAAMERRRGADRRLEPAPSLSRFGRCIVR
jgi:hypothetical protein